MQVTAHCVYKEKFAFQMLSILEKHNYNTDKYKILKEGLPVGNFQNFMRQSATWSVMGLNTANKKVSTVKNDITATKPATR
ncbi:MAG: hypothetical protein U5L01_11535 [Rheinheimera sp.]|nr:hypothetical protein [Rheinheimera sp.]